MLGRFSRDDEWDKPRFLADWTGGFLLAPAALFDSPGRQPRTTARIGASSFFEQEHEHEHEQEQETA